MLHLFGYARRKGVKYFVKGIELVMWVREEE
jgi:hypothetical protein